MIYTATVERDEQTGFYVGIASVERKEVATQGESLTEVRANLREAVALHLDVDDLESISFHWNR